MHTRSAVFPTTSAVLVKTAIITLPGLERRTYQGKIQGKKVTYNVVVPYIYDLKPINLNEKTFLTKVVFKLSRY